MVPYEAALRLTPMEHKLRPSATRIFRELPNKLATAKLIGKDPADVHILGCSDVSEAYAHAIAIKESIGNSATHNVNIVGIDYTPRLAD